MNSCIYVYVQYCIILYSSVSPIEGIMSPFVDESSHFYKCNQDNLTQTCSKKISISGAILGFVKLTFYNNIITIA